MRSIARPRPASAGFTRDRNVLRSGIFLAPLALLAAGCGAAPSESVGHAVQGVISGDIYNFGALAHPGSCMDAQGGGTTDGTQIQEWMCNGTGAQSFELEDDGNGGFYIVNTQANKCVDVQGAGTANGTKIQLYDCNQRRRADVRHAGRGERFRLLREHEQQQVPRRRGRQPGRRNRRAALRLQPDQRAAVEPQP